MIASSQSGTYFRIEARGGFIQVSYPHPTRRARLKVGINKSAAVSPRITFVLFYGGKTFPALSSPFSSSGNNFTLKSMRRSRSPLSPLPFGICFGYRRIAVRRPPPPSLHRANGHSVDFPFQFFVTFSRTNMRRRFGQREGAREDEDPRRLPLAVTCAPMKRKMVQWTNSPVLSLLGVFPTPSA